MTKIFIVSGIILIAIGVLLYFLKDFPIFRLPGDIAIKKENFSFYFPITSSIILSIVFTLLFSFISRFFK